MKTKKLINGVCIPQMGMGTWPLRSTTLERAMEDALEVGYRLFDTADNYGNEEEIGNVINRNQSIRHEIFIMTKISDEKFIDPKIPWSSRGKYFYKASPLMKTMTARDVVDMLVENSLKKLKTDYIDCLIMHWPYPDYLTEIWEEMIVLYNNGIVKSIGVSNCRERHIDELSKSSVMPMVNQICVSPLDTKESLLKYCTDKHIQVVCYAPLMMMNNPLIAKASIIKNLCNKYDIPLASLLLAWNMNKGIIPIPKSTNKSRMLSNFIADKYNLMEADLKAIDSLNKDIQYLPESLFCPGL